MTEPAAPYRAQRLPAARHGCWRSDPLPHPWLPIQDCACGHDDRLTHPQCHGCHRQRPESVADQLAALNGLGDAAGDFRGR
jgi:hypothetical protein